MGLICAFGYIAHFMDLLRGSPLLFSDFSNFGTGIDMLSEFDFRLNFRAYIFAVALFALMIVNSKIRIGKRLGWKPRVTLVVVFCVGWVGLIGGVVFSDYFSWNRFKVSTFRPMSSGYNLNGGLLSLVRSAKISIVRKPADYSPKLADQIVSEISAGLAQQYPATAASEYRKPNIIAIMNESFTDIASIGEGIETNIDPLPFYHGLTENTVKGWAYASGLGGGTANSEFEFFTGNTLAFLPLNASPYQLYMKHEQPSLVSTLKAQGYQGNVAVHPYKRDGYSRPRAYEMLDFDEYLDETDFEDPTMLRDFISDEADYNKLISLYEGLKSDSDAPVFLWTITMQNHGSYEKEYDNFDPQVQATSELLPIEQGEYHQVDKVLSLMYESDKATEQLVNYFKNVAEPTVVIMFGDHQPKLPSAFYTKVLGGKSRSLTPEDLMDNYRVPFFIWANFDIEEKTLERVSMNYLHVLAMDAAGMEMTDYDKYLLNLFQEIPCLTVYGHYDANGKFYDAENEIASTKNINPKALKKSNATPQDEVLYQYSVLEYNNLFDWKNRVKDFFYLKEPA
jgi:phosphoglycerol transferase MdoB-like AlkP superfamily enzyme